MKLQNIMRTQLVIAGLAIVLLVIAVLAIVLLFPSKRSSSPSLKCTPPKAQLSLAHTTQEESPQ